MRSWRAPFQGAEKSLSILNRPSAMATSTHAPLPDAQLAARADKLQELLREAIMDNNIPLVNKRFEQGANPSAPAKNGQSSLLMLAIKAQSPELIARLTPSADLGETDRNGLTALHHFISSIHTPPAMGSELLPALRSLITPSSATTRSLIGFSPLDVHAQRAQGSPPFHSDDTFASIVRELLPFSANSALDGYKACVAALDSNSDQASAKSLALLEAHPLKDKILAMSCPLRGQLSHVAAATGQTEFLRSIAPVVNIDSRNAQGLTPFMVALCTSSRRQLFSSSPMSAALLLLDLGADPLLVDDNGCDALMLAIEYNRDAISKSDNVVANALAPIIKLSDLSRRDFLGESALDKALDRDLAFFADMIRAQSSPSCPNSSSTSIKFSSLNPANSRSHLQSLLHDAVARDNMALVDKRLLQGAQPLSHQAEASCNISFGGETPLILAAQYANLSMVRRLLPLSNPLATNVRGDTALLAFLSNEITTQDHLAILAELATPESALIKDARGQSPLAVIRASDALLPEAMAILAPLSDWLSTDLLGRGILGGGYFSEAKGLAIWNGHPDQHAFANAQDSEGRSLVHTASCIGQLNFLRRVSDYVDFDQRDHLMRTPLLSACATPPFFPEQLHATIEFLSARNDCRSVDINGCDALMLLIENTLSPDPILAATPLIDRVDLNARDFLGESAMDKARDRSHHKILAAIQSRLAIFAERDALHSASEISAARPRSARAKRM